MKTDVREKCFHCGWPDMKMFLHTVWFTMPKHHIFKSAVYSRELNMRVLIARKDLIG